MQRLIFQIPLALLFSMSFISFCWSYSASSWNRPTMRPYITSAISLNEPFSGIHFRFHISWCSRQIEDKINLECWLLWHLSAMVVILLWFEFICDDQNLILFYCEACFFLRISNCRFRNHWCSSGFNKLIENSEESIQGNVDDRWENFSSSWLILANILNYVVYCQE